MSVDYLHALQSCPAAKAGRLAFFECERVPRKFNARSHATWRRYTYIFPLKWTTPPRSPEPGFGAGIELPWLNTLLSHLEDRPLPYNAYAYGPLRTGAQGLRDTCTLFRARATAVALRERGSCDAVAVELVGSRFLRRMVRILVATALREARRTPRSSVDRLKRIALDGNRDAAALALPPHGLVLCGVGYDTDVQLRQFKGVPSKPEKLAALDTQVLRLLEGCRRNGVRPAEFT
jgi:tRNA U38,U39,U40 pseudouridine synthase TruA